MKKENTSTQVLSNSIIDYSFMCTDTLKEYYDRLPKAERQRARTYVLFEFTYFWMHMANRTANMEIGNESRIKLQMQLGPLVIEPIVKKLFWHWFKKRRQNLISELFEKLNEAELDYANCKPLSPEGDLYKDESIFSKLATNVARLFSQGDNSDFLRVILNVTINTYNEIDLKSLVSAAEKEL